MSATVRAEDAGLQPGDEILTIDGKKVMNKDWDSTLNRYKQGDRVTISFKRDRRTLQTTLVFSVADRFEYRIEEMKDATVGQKALRAAWLKGN
ncbi:MAG: PDZ domain-containing protein [Pyrinomonadaceae bacterium]|nr:PDZ domain-containing protein [Pyrinomonadaceae bacterium]